MRRIWIDVEDSAGTRQGDGPITSATGWEQTYALDRIGRFSFRMPASDPRAALIQPRRIVRARSGSQVLGAGVVDSIRTTEGEGAVPWLEISGMDLGQELTWKSVGSLELAKDGWTRPVGAFRIKIDPSTGQEVAGNYADFSASIDENPATGAAWGGGSTNWHWLYIGVGQPFNKLYFDISSPSGGTRLGWTFQYYNGFAWVAVSNLVDGTAWWQQDGEMTWTMPSDWETSTQRGIAGYWVRIQPIADCGAILNEIRAWGRVPTDGALAQIAAKFPAGWSLDTVNGRSTTVKTDVYGLLDGESVLQALIKLGELTGEHFYVTPERKVVWLGNTLPTLSYRLTNAPPDPVAGESNADAYPILSLEATRETYEKITRVYPIGAGLGSGRLTLAHSTKAVPSGYVVDRNNNYVKKVPEDDYQSVEAWVPFKDVGASTMDAWARRQASNQLLDAAVVYLARHSVDAYSYSVRVGRLTQTVYAGSKIRVDYHRFVAGYAAYSINQDLIVLESEVRVDESGVQTTRLTLSTVEAWPTTDEELLARLLQQTATLGHYPQPVEVSQVNSSDTSTVGLPLTVGNGGLAFTGGANTVSSGGGGSTIPNPHRLDGPNHYVTGLTAGQYLRASNEYTAIFDTIKDADLPSTVVRTSRQIVSGGGLTGGGDLSVDRTLAVGAGPGITVNADDVAVKLASPSGLQVDVNGLALADSIAGNGLTIASKVLAVGQGDGLTVNPDSVALTTPGTLSVSSVNSPVGSHTHAVTASANPGAASALLKSDASGLLQLVGLGIGIAPAANRVNVYGRVVAGSNGFGQVELGYDDATNVWLQTLDSNRNLALQAHGTGVVYVADQLNVDGDLYFVGAQAIRTTADSLTLAPAADLDLTPGGTARVRATNGVRLQSDNYASQTTGWGISYAGAGDFRYLYTDEMHAKAFVADLEQALAGGQIISKSVAPLAADFTVPAAGAQATMVVETFKGFDSFHVFVDGDLVRVRAFDRSGTSLTIGNAWGTVTWASTDTTNHTQTYTFTRSASPNEGSITAGTVVKAGVLVLDYGTSGNGYLESTAIDGAMAEYAPYQQVVTWTSHPNSGLSVKTRLGNLKGIFNTADEYGLYAGTGVTDADKYLRISNTAVEGHNLPIKLYDGASVTLALDPAVPSLAMGATLPSGYGTGTGLWAGKDGGTYKFRVGEPAGEALAWDGASLFVQADGNNYLKATGTSLQFYSNAIKVMEFANTPSILIGQEAAGQSNVYIASGGVQLRSNTTVHIDLQSDGDVLIGHDTSAAASTNLAIFSNAQTYNSESLGAGDLLIGDNSANKANALWDKSAGQLLFRGGTTIQAYVDTDGSIKAGGGVVTLNQSGLALQVGQTSANTVRWLSDVNEAASIRTWISGTHTITMVQAGDFNSYFVNSELWLRAYHQLDSSKDAKVDLYALDTPEVRIIIGSQTALSAFSNNVTIPGGLNVGTATGAPTGTGYFLAAMPAASSYHAVVRAQDSTLIGTAAGSYSGNLLNVLGNVSGYARGLHVYNRREIDADNWWEAWTRVAATVVPGDYPQDHQYNNLSWIEFAWGKVSIGGNVLIGTTTDAGYRLQVAGGIRTTWSQSTVQTLTPNGWNTITHNLNLPASNCVILAENGDYNANAFTISGVQYVDANSFRFWASGGTASLARINWIIFGATS